MNLWITPTRKRMRREEFHLPALFFLGANFFLALLHGYREWDGAELKIDLKRVGVTRVQVGGDEVKLPVVTNKVEGNVGNIRSADFVHVVHRAPHAGQHGYRTATPAGKDRVRVGDGVAVGVAHGELNWNRAATLPFVDAATVRIDWR